jgi:hypothetical protein
MCSYETFFFLISTDYTALYPRRQNSAVKSSNPLVEELQRTCGSKSYHFLIVLMTRMCMYVLAEMATVWRPPHSSVFLLHSSRPVRESPQGSASSLWLNISVNSAATGMLSSSATFRIKVDTAVIDNRCVCVCVCVWRRPPLWSSGQSSWLHIRRPGFDSRYYQKKSSGSGTESTQPREYN